MSTHLLILLTLLVCALVALSAGLHVVTTLRSKVMYCDVPNLEYLLKLHQMLEGNVHELRLGYTLWAEIHNATLVISAGNLTILREISYVRLVFRHSYPIRSIEGSVWFLRSNSTSTYLESSIQVLTLGNDLYLKYYSTTAGQHTYLLLREKLKVTYLLYTNSDLVIKLLKDSGEVQMWRFGPGYWRVHVYEVRIE